MCYIYLFCGGDMITRFKLENLLKDLEAFFPNHKPKSEYQINTYYGELKENEEQILKKAFKFLISTRTTRSFPLIKEINLVCRKIREQQSFASAQELEPINCDICGGTGVLWIKTKFSGREYDAVKPCTCEAGKIREKAYQNWERKIKEGKPILEDWIL